MKQHINPEAAKYHQSPLLNQLMTPDLWRNGSAHTNGHTTYHPVGIALISMQWSEFYHCIEQSS